MRAPMWFREMVELTEEDLLLLKLLRQWLEAQRAESDR